MGMERRNHRDNQEEKLFDERVLNVDRVARVVKGGRRFRFRALVVVGDKKGKIGIGIAKGADVTSAVSKAVDSAKKTMFEIVNDNGTIPHEVQEKVGGAVVLIKPASAGTGLIAGGVVRTLLEVAGISNALSKNLGSSNKVNTAYATLKALNALTPKSEWVVNSNQGSKTSTKAVVKDTIERASKPAAKKTPVKKVATKKSAAKELKK